MNFNFENLLSRKRTTRVPAMLENEKSATCIDTREKSMNKWNIVVT